MEKIPEEMTEDDLTEFFEDVDFIKYKLSQKRTRYVIYILLVLIFIAWIY